jgi:hypothetical protein
MLATMNEDTARRVAEDIRAMGYGYVRFDREGRAEHVPPPLDSPSIPERTGWIHE